MDDDVGGRADGEAGFVSDSAFDMNGRAGGAADADPAGRHGEVGPSS